MELSFPSDWEVTERPMAGHDKPALTDDQMRAALREPDRDATTKRTGQGQREGGHSLR